MENSIVNYSILKSYLEVRRFIPDVVFHADSDRNSLGFFANSVFSELAKSEQLFVAVMYRDGEQHYAGHLMFKCSKSKASVLQLFIAQDFRKKGLGEKLIKSLKEDLTKNGLIYITARVAEDLVESNAFWQKQDFNIQRLAQGGRTRNRKIIVRCHELASPQLFPSSGFSASDPLGLSIPSILEIPIYLLDLNVLFDLGSRRTRNPEAINLFNSERMGLFKLAISSEISLELERTTTSKKTDPLLDWIKIFPSFRTTKDSRNFDLFDQLGRLVFPEKNLTANDKSDLVHIVTAIEHKLTGLITSDEKLLDAAKTIKDKFDVQIISLLTFSQSNSLDSDSHLQFETNASIFLELRDVTVDDENNVIELLKKLHVAPYSIATDWVANKAERNNFSRFCVLAGSSLIGYLVWRISENNEKVLVRIAVDESLNNSTDVAKLLLMRLLDIAISKNALQIEIDFPDDQVSIREIASTFGFSGNASKNSLNKIALGRIFAGENWANDARSILSACNLNLPRTLPVFDTVKQFIELSNAAGNRAFISLFDLETLLAPALFCFEKRNAVITPITINFSKHLLGDKTQSSLLPIHKSALENSKRYICGPNNLKKFKFGDLILFYESSKKKGSSSIIAIARVTQVYLRAVELLENDDFSASVIDVETIEIIGSSSNKTIVTFDNLISLPHPVPLTTLKKLGCGQPTDLISTNAIKNEQLQAILKEGWKNGGC